MAHAVVMLLATASLPLYGQDAPATYQVESIRNPGRLTGVVKFEESAPASQAQKVSENADICGPEKNNQPVRVSNGGLENVIIAIKDVPRGKANPPAPELALQQCEFLPRVQGLVAGQRLTLRNRDDMPHKITGKTPSGRTLFSLYQPIQGSKHRKLIPESGLIHIRAAEEMPWAMAWLYVAENPYFTTTGYGGQFSIEGIPPGTYQLIAWHELLGTQSTTITIEGHGHTTAQFSYSLGHSSSQ